MSGWLLLPVLSHSYSFKSFLRVSSFLKLPTRKPPMQNQLFDFPQIEPQVTEIAQEATTTVLEGKVFRADKVNSKTHPKYKCACIN